VPLRPALASCVGLPDGASRGPGPCSAISPEGAGASKSDPVPHMPKQPNGTARSRRRHRSRFGWAGSPLQQRSMGIWRGGETCDACVGAVGREASDPRGRSPKFRRKFVFQSPLHQDSGTWSLLADEHGPRCVRWRSGRSWIARPQSPRAWTWDLSYATKRSSRDE
jgi:hypothetical protein